MARLVYVALQLLCLYHGHRDNLTPTWSLIACPFVGRIRPEEEKKRALQSLSGPNSVSTLIVMTVVQQKAKYVQGLF